jgi:septal ring-binding cell division protein DamX
MPSKKKSKPLFEVPVEISSGQESGWVYRSGAAETTAERETKTETDTPIPRAAARAASGAADTSLSAASAHTFALVVAALTQTFVLGVTIAALPMTMGLQMLNALAKRRETR